MHITNAIDIPSTVELLWALTLDVERWPDHTPTLTSVRRLDDGPMRVGVRAAVKQPGQAERTWTVTELDPGRRFAWSATLAGATMTGTHDLEPAPGGGTRQTLALDLEGRTARWLGLVLRRPVARALARENAGFAEAAAAMAA